MYDLAIIGGGMSGMIASILACRRGYKVVLIESNDKLGKKLLATGNGKCNLTNIDMNTSYYNTDAIADILAEYTPDRVRADLLNLGIITKVKSGRVYPYSEQASSVLKVLLDNIESNGVSVKTSTTIYNIDWSADEECYILPNDSESILAKKVCLASGSNACFGRTSLSLLTNIDHDIVPLKCALSALQAECVSDTSGLSGVRQEGLVTLYVDGKSIASEFGEIQFRQEGVSGIVMFNMQSRLAWLDKQSAEVSIDFMPDYTLEQVREFARNDTTYALGMLHMSLMEKIKLRGIDSIKDYRIKVRACDDFKFAQVTSGGLDLNMFSLEDMQSVLWGNIFAIGEVLDVDGLCGGYNLHWAYASASKFANALKEIV